MDSKLFFRQHYVLVWNDEEEHGFQTLFLGSIMFLLRMAFFPSSTALISVIPAQAGIHALKRILKGLINVKLV